MVLGACSIDGGAEEVRQRDVINYSLARIAHVRERNANLEARSRARGGRQRHTETLLDLQRLIRERI